MFSDERTVADHERVWARHETLSDPEHREAAKALRRTRIGALRSVRGADAELAVEQRPLVDYDAALVKDLDTGSEGGYAS